MKRRTQTGIVFIAMLFSRSLCASDDSKPLEKLTFAELRQKIGNYNEKVLDKERNRLAFLICTTKCLEFIDFLCCCRKSQLDPKVVADVTHKYRYMDIELEWRKKGVIKFKEST